MNFLKLNTDKREILLIGTKSSLSKPPRLTLTIDHSYISPSEQVKSLAWLLQIPPVWFPAENPPQTPTSTELICHPLITSHQSYSSSTGSPSHTPTLKNPTAHRQGQSQPRTCLNSFTLPRPPRHSDPLPLSTSLFPEPGWLPRGAEHSATLLLNSGIHSPIISGTPSAFCLSATQNPPLQTCSVHLTAYSLELCYVIYLCVFEASFCVFF